MLWDQSYRSDNEYRYEIRQSQYNDNIDDDNDNNNGRKK